MCFMKSQKPATVLLEMGVMSLHCAGDRQDDIAQSYKGPFVLLGATATSQPFKQHLAFKSLY